MLIWHETSSVGRNIFLHKQNCGCQVIVADKVLSPADYWTGILTLISPLNAP